MKVMTVLGTRPEIIRLSLVIRKLDALCRHTLVHTGQNFDARLSELFFRELKVRAPDHHLGVRGSFAEQTGKILAGCEGLMQTERPDRLLVLGDTNSGLAAVVAKRLGIPVYHMEAGNRCYDDRVPEEVNRRIIDHSSDVLMPYTERSRANLLREGIPGHRIYVTGNPIHEVLEHNRRAIARSTILRKLRLRKQRYLLITLHRAENVDGEKRLRGYVRAFERLQESYSVPVVVSTHTRTRSRMESFGIRGRDPKIRFLAPFGFHDFVALEQAALCVLTDSGTVQEECAIFGIPNVTLRDVTERPETLECGSNILAGGDPETVLTCTRVALAHKGPWCAPEGYLTGNVSRTVVKVVLGFRFDPSATGASAP
jgi:UDP-N-acetylglucosamine 2-epimerase (non-hydrolysing)